MNQAYEGAMKLEQYYYSPQPYIAIVVEEFGDFVIDRSVVGGHRVASHLIQMQCIAAACDPRTFFHG